MRHPAVRVGTAALATWRVTHLLAREDGPADAILRGRAALGTSRLGALMDCFDCMSLWVAAPFVPLAAHGSARERVACWLALSGAACLLDRAARGGTTAIWEDDDGLLWQGARRAQGVDATDGIAPGAGAVGRERAGAGTARDGHADPAAVGTSADRRRAGRTAPTIADERGAASAATGSRPLRSGT